MFQKIIVFNILYIQAENLKLLYVHPFYLLKISLIALMQYYYKSANSNAELFQIRDCSKMMPHTELHNIVDQIIRIRRQCATTELHELVITYL